MCHQVGTTEANPPTSLPHSYSLSPINLLHFIALSLLFLVYDKHNVNITSSHIAHAYDTMSDQPAVASVYT